MDILSQASGLPAGSPMTPIPSPGAFSSMIQPQEQAAQPKPPANPQELQERTQGWMGVFEKIRSDPVLQGQLFHIGTALAAPMQPGANGFSHLTGALANGRKYVELMKWQEQQNAMQQQEESRKTAESAARVEASNANAEASRTGSKVRLSEDARAQVRANQETELFPETKEKLRVDLENAHTDAAIKKAKKDEAEFLANPERMARKLKLDEDRVRADIMQSRAAAGASSAAAGNASARTKREQEAWNMLTPEEKKQQTLGLADETFKAQETIKPFLARVPLTVTDPAARQKAAWDLFAQQEGAKGEAALINALNGAVNAGVWTPEEAAARMPSSTQPKAQPTASPTPVEGKIYVDAAGNRAKYSQGKYIPIGK